MKLSQMMIFHFIRFYHSEGSSYIFSQSFQVLEFGCSVDQRNLDNYHCLLLDHLKIYNYLAFVKFVHNFLSIHSNMIHFQARSSLYRVSYHLLAQNLSNHFHFYGKTVKIESLNISYWFHWILMLVHYWFLIICWN